MIEVDATADATPQRRRTWMTGGVLFVTSALLGIGAPGIPLGISPLLFGAGAVVFAIGLGRGGSVTARRPLGTGAIIALVVWTLIGIPVLWTLVESTPIDAVDDSYVTAAGAAGMTGEIVSLALAIIAVVQVGRIGVVPKPWNWAPLWALIVVVAAQLIPNLIAVALRNGDQMLLGSLFAVITLVSAGAVAFMGIVAMMLAVRPIAGETVVFASRS